MFGQTKKPINRSWEHRRDYGDVHLCIIKTVPIEQSTYWECKTIVDLTDAGCQLINKMTRGKMNEGHQESLIYFLRNEIGSVVYVGQTVDPARRFREHKSDSKGNLDGLHVIRSVPIEQSTYWECKTIISMIDAGCKLTNKMNRGRNKSE